MCVTCYDKDGHPHKMEKLGLDLDDGSTPADQKQANPQVSSRTLTTTIEFYNCKTMQFLPCNVTLL